MKLVSQESLELIGDSIERLRKLESKVINQTALAVITASGDVLRRSQDLPRAMAIQGLGFAEFCLMGVNHGGLFDPVLLNVRAARQIEALIDEMKL